MNSLPVDLEIPWAFLRCSLGEPGKVEREPLDIAGVHFQSVLAGPFGVASGIGILFIGLSEHRP